ncbi:MAG: hypothetical protein K0S41_4304 [Anaerocolumna sp.]|nr:hypothetical protein [Anaerocolumna sp.]
MIVIIPSMRLLSSFTSNTSMQTVMSNANVQQKENINLLNSYEENDEIRITQYFKDWNEKSKKLTKTKYENELEENLYKIFKVVYQPYNMVPLINEQMLDYFEHDLIKVINQAPYIVVQNQLHYTIEDLKDTNEDVYDEYDEYLLTLMDSKNEIKTINNFYPQIDIDFNKVLYLTYEYEVEIISFLGGEERPFSEKNIMAPAIPKGETEKRYQWLRKYIPILYGHWGGYWHLPTHPEILNVYINKELTHAIANYRIGYNFGFAELKKVNGDWVLIKALMNGME